MTELVQNMFIILKNVSGTKSSIKRKKKKTEKRKMFKSANKAKNNSVLYRDIRNIHRYSKRLEIKVQEKLFQTHKNNKKSEG